MTTTRKSPDRMMGASRQETGITACQSIGHAEYRAVVPFLSMNREAFFLYVPSDAFHEGFLFPMSHTHDSPFLSYSYN